MCIRDRYQRRVRACPKKSMFQVLVTHEKGEPMLFRSLSTLVLAGCVATVSTTQVDAKTEVRTYISQKCLLSPDPKKKKKKKKKNSTLIPISFTHLMIPQNTLFYIFCYSLHLNTYTKNNR
eukprot:TRINITY_DN28440_c0_g1_i1.p1 TRINITY_DN28440_c0_g1~~TRINITY_DN28440_c0_g1_i1.p1  ORF type:complete len:121 (-),score=18.37 TRINITY_DN28440_c0_g1_i1:12-374(-)